VKSELRELSQSSFILCEIIDAYANDREKCFLRRKEKLHDQVWSLPVIGTLYRSFCINTLNLLKCDYKLCRFRERSADDAHGLSLSLFLSLSVFHLHLYSLPLGLRSFILQLAVSISLPFRLDMNIEASSEITAPLVTTYNVLTLLLELLITVITGA